MLQNRKLRLTSGNDSSVTQEAVLEEESDQHPKLLNDVSTTEDLRMYEHFLAFVISETKFKIKRL